MEKIGKLIFVIAAALLLVACNEPQDAWPVRDRDQPLTGEFSDGLFIVNEGNFGWGYGTLSYGENESGRVSHDLFSAINGRILGNVAQSMAYHDGNYYIVVNNSQKIEVVDAISLESVAIINKLVSPRYLLPVADQVGYVTDLYEDSIAVVDLRKKEVISKIYSGGQTEKLASHEELVYVCAPVLKEIIVISPDSHTIVKRIACPGSPNSLQIDQNGTLWVLCGSGSESQASLLKINVQSLRIERQFAFPRKGDWPNNLSINMEGNTLYYLNGGVYQFLISDEQVNEEPIIVQGNALYYGLGVDADGEIYVTDAKDYVQAGSVYHYSSGAQVIDTLEAGVIPGSFLFTNRINN